VSGLVAAFHVGAGHFLAVLLASAIKGSVVFAAVYGAIRLMREGDPRLKHLLWLGTIGSYLIILVLSLLGPALLPAGGGPGDPVSALLLPQRAAPIPAVAGVPAWAGAPRRLWVLLVAGLWLMGVLAGLSRLGSRAWRLRRLSAESARGRRRGAAGGEHWAPLARRLAAAVGLSRPVRVLESHELRVPFAAGVLRPLVVLPASARHWAAGRVRAVLLHELRHIRRCDPLTQTAAYLVCSLFWFVPLIWLAHSHLYMEQEKACDSGVVRDGVNPGEYAACLLEFARLHREPAASAGLYVPGWRKRVLSERIQHIVGGALSGSKGRQVFAVAVLVICVLVAAGGTGVRQAPWNEALFQRFVGRWVNEQYSGAFAQPQVTVITPDYLGEEWAYPDSARVAARYTVEVRRLWVDAQGYTYCQFFSRPLEGMPLNTVTLMRVDSERKVCEMNTSIVATEASAVYPDQINPLWTKYWIYFRE